MIVHWKKNNVKVVPITQGLTVLGKVTLLPGFNEVSKEDWERASVNCVDDIKRGNVVEVGVTEPKVEKKGANDVRTIKSAKEFAKLELEEAEEIVEDTYDLKTLKAWEKKESRDSIRAAIKNRIALVKKHGTEGAKKKSSSKED